MKGSFAIDSTAEVSVAALVGLSVLVFTVTAMTSATDFLNGGSSQTEKFSNRANEVCNSDAVNEKEVFLELETNKALVLENPADQDGGRVVLMNQDQDREEESRTLQCVVEGGSTGEYGSGRYSIEIENSEIQVR